MKLLSLLKTTTLSMAFVLIFNSCSKNNDEISYDLEGDWKVTYFLDNGKKLVKSDDNTWPDLNNGDITASFTKPDSNGKGTFSGIKVSNGYSGEYTIKSQGTIETGPIVTTLINEPEWTKLYYIDIVENYEVRNGKLLLSYNNGKNVIAFERN
ncbi:hypothetical protein [uncultured Croceitalea sp.]|uniref:hypothetical protein n=1 Tax=uncultured Croceitalea sp. TaxID=1798908 RepID=UPI00330621F1